MIGKAGGHCGGSRLPAAVAVFDAQRSQGPTEIVTTHREVSDRVMHVPVLRETVAFADLAGVAVAVGPVLAFDDSTNAVLILRLTGVRRHVPAAAAVQFEM